MNAIIITLIPTISMLLLGALIWYSDPGVRALRKQERKIRSR